MRRWRHQVVLDEAVIGTSLQVVHLQVNGLEGDQGSSSGA
jgi:hypothetical protein